MLANLFILLLGTVMDRYRAPSRGGLVLSGSVPLFNGSGTVYTSSRTVLDLSVNRLRE